MTPVLLAFAAILIALAGALLLIYLVGPRPVRVPPAHPRRTVQETLDETGEEVDATVFAFPARPTNPDGDQAA